MARTTTLISFLGAGLAFAAACATLAMMGLGVPMLLAALLAAAAAGLVLHAALRAQVARPAAALQGQLEAAQAGSAGAEPRLAAMAARLAEVEARASSLRHDLRGILSPALMVTDRLLNNPDPAVQRAGQAVVRTVERATDLIQASKLEPAAAAPDAPAGPAAA